MACGLPVSHELTANVRCLAIMVELATLKPLNTSRATFRFWLSACILEIFWNHASTLLLFAPDCPLLCLFSAVASLYEGKERWGYLLPLFFIDLRSRWEYRRSIMICCYHCCRWCCYWYMWWKCCFRKTCSSFYIFHHFLFLASWQEQIMRISNRLKNTSAGRKRTKCERQICRVRVLPPRAVIDWCFVVSLCCHNSDPVFWHNMITEDGIDSQCARYPWQISFLFQWDVDTIASGH